MKKILIVLIFVFITHLQTQTFVKADVFSKLLTIPNVGIETFVEKKPAFQFSKIELFK